MGRTIASHRRDPPGGCRRRRAARCGRRRQQDRDLLKSTLAARIEAKLDELFTRTETPDRREPARGARRHPRARDAQDPHRRGHRGRDHRAAGPAGRRAPVPLSGVPRAAEAYHEIVVAAHGVHGKVDVPLPQLNGHGELTALAPTTPELHARARRLRPRRTVAVASRRPSSLQEQLELHHVEPAVELPADLALDAHDLEAASLVQRDRRVVATHDAGDHRVEPVDRARGAPAPRAAAARVPGLGRSRCT